MPKWVQAQTTYASVVKGEDGEYAVRVIKQKIWVEAVSYELQEIYGIEQCNSGASTSQDDIGKVSRKNPQTQYSNFTVHFVAFHPLCP